MTSMRLIRAPVLTVVVVVVAAASAAGAAALYLQCHPLATPAEVKDAIVAAATPGIITNTGTSPNPLLHLRN